MIKKNVEQKNNPLVSVVILNWNGLADTLACIQSVNELTYKNIELIVVDNGSERPITADDIDSPIKTVVAKNDVNKGFAGGEVSALPYCSGDYIFLLNNDAIIDKDAISEAVATFETDDNIAVVGGRSYSLHDDLHESLGYYSFQYIDPVTAETHTYNHDDGIQDTVTVSGAAVMIRRTAIESYGYFDERFFAYYEETDLFARYLRAGLRVVYNPKVIIWHKDGASTKNKRYMYYYLMLKNQFLFAYKNFDSDALHQFLSVYARNFRRSLWLVLKNPPKLEAIHKARVRSALWNILNIFGTIVTRRRTQSINPAFSYTNTLLTKQPIRATLVIDARGKIDESNLMAAVNNILSAPSYPSEIVIVTTKAITLPKASHIVAMRNIIDKKHFQLTARDFGFMSSNTEVLFFTNYNELFVDKTSFSETLTNSYRAIIKSEAAIAVKDFSGSDLRITNGNTSTIVAIRKSDLVNFLDIHADIFTIDNGTLGKFINWIVMDCRPVIRLAHASSAFEIQITSPESTHATLTKPYRWRLKKLVRILHVARIIAVVKKRLLRTPIEVDIEIDIVPEVFPVYKKSTIQDTPIFINTRDRVEPLRDLLKWLESGKYNKVVFIDNDSTYPDLIDLFDTTPYQVIHLGRNGMHKSPWESFAIRFMAKDKPYVVTDPDIVPTPQTPLDTISHLYAVLAKYPAYIKAGVALKIDDLPDHYSMRQSVIDWESRFWSENLLLEKDVYSADLDTTFALYKGGSWWSLTPSIRVGVNTQCTTNHGIKTSTSRQMI